MKPLLKILIIGNEENSIIKIENCISSLEHNIISTLSNTDEAWFEIFVNEPDLIILSAKAKGIISALGLSKKTQFLNIPILIVDITQESERLEGFDQIPFLKCIYEPFENEKLVEAIHSIHEKERTIKSLPFLTSKQDYLFLKKNNMHEKVLISDILFIKSEGNYCATSVANGEKYINRISLLEIAKLLNSSDFKKSHRSYLVNINKIDSINLSQSIIRIGDTSIPISRNAKSYFLNSYKVIN